ncbi:hypothetical protein [Pseudomonas aeruginosa]|uniref:Uncharacterized protein n=1 Tax=Pseudomonas aeruginosa TaxID=287 RepID=A0A6A9JZ06_PSEAI|nr:hypothetical protein [Pseudomonas aeruginosa]MUI58042.1 hypothetical protein [Pseudomonas aeruginosa]
MNVHGWINAVGLLVLAFVLWARWAQFHQPVYPVCWLGWEDSACWSLAAPTGR